METKMKRIASVMAAVGLTTTLLIGAASAADLSQTVVLVATDSLDGSPFAQAVVIAAPLPDGGHAGFVVNRPTKVKLENLFPDQPAARDVTEPVYVGGPFHSDSVFVLTQSAPAGRGVAVPLTPGVFAVVDATAIDGIIGNTPNAARYFVGMMLWGPDELAEQIDNGLWEVRPADVHSVLPARARGLWNALRGPTV